MKLDETKAALTIAYINLFFGKFTKKIKYKCKGCIADVYIFSDKSKKGAQCTIFNTIIMQDLFFKNYSKPVVDCVFLHEVGHTKFNKFLMLFFYLLIIPLLYVFFFLIPITLLVPLLSYLILEMPIKYIFSTFIVYLIAFFVVSLFIALLSWSIECHADLFAVKKIGINNYLKCYNEIRIKSQKKSIIRKYFDRVRYPPEKLVVWFWKQFSQNRFNKSH